MTLIDILAIWGAGLSTFLALLKLLGFRKDRAIVKITVKGGYKVFSKNNPYGDMTILSVTVANRGRRPITIKNVGLIMPRGSKAGLIVCADPITALKPFELTEGKSHVYNFNEDEIEKENKLTPDKHIACAADATGKIYYSHNFLTRLIKLHKIK